MPPYYNSYFGTPYPLPKLDLIAAPGSSPFFGAMENWGAIFYFERDLLIDARLATAGDKQRVYIVVAHEMAHQWFGDLVTMAWWDDLWLNEGFASWMENKVTDHFHPDWKVWLQSAEETQAAMQEDARDGTHPIVTPIDDVLQASSAFDSITYLKGAAVIRMLESYVGEKAFRAGVRRYMHDHAYGNTVTDDLWKEIDKETQRPITQIAHDFTLQAGVPMVSERSRLCRDGQATLRLSQEHFAVDAASTTARLWHIPVISAHPAGPTVTTIVAGGAPTTVRLAGCGALIINAGQTGYFRSRYSSDGMAAIGADYRSLSPEDQLGVLNDSSALADSGLESTAALLNLTKELPADADPVVAATLVDLFEQLDIIYDGLPTQAAFRAYARGALDPLLARVGWDARPGEADNDALLRSDLLAALGYFADPAVLAEARKRFDRYLDDPSRLDAGGRRTVLGIVAAHADAPTWDRLHGMARSAKTEIERQELYDLLASAQDATLVSQALELALSGEPPPTIAPEMIIAASRRHPATAFQFAISHWDRLAPLIVPTALPSFIPRLLGSASNTDLIGQLDAFAQAHIPAGARQDLRKAEANVRHLARIRSDRLPAVDRWITQERGAGGR